MTRRPAGTCASASRATVANAVSAVSWKLSSTITASAGSRANSARNHRRANAAMSPEDSAASLGRASPRRRRLRAAACARK